MSLLFHPRFLSQITPEFLGTETEKENLKPSSKDLPEIKTNPISCICKPWLDNQHFKHFIDSEHTVCLPSMSQPKRIAFWLNAM